MESEDLEDKTLSLKHSHEGAKTQEKKLCDFVAKNN